MALGDLAYSQGIGGPMNVGSFPGEDYAAAYQNALQQNLQLWNYTIQGYDRLGQQLASNANNIVNQYGQLTQQGLALLEGADASQKQEIADAFARESGAASQDLINRGLGNTTVQNSVQGGIALNKQKALTQLAGQTAQQKANLLTGLGGQSLQAQQQLSNALAGIGSQALGAIGNVQARYPNMSDYANAQLAKGKAMTAGAGLAWAAQGRPGMARLNSPASPQATYTPSYLQTPNYQSPRVTGGGGYGGGQTLTPLDTFNQQNQYQGNQRGEPQMQEYNPDNYWNQRGQPQMQEQNPNAWSPMDPSQPLLQEEQPNYGGGQGYYDQGGYNAAKPDYSSADSGYGYMEQIPEGFGNYS